MFAEAETSPFGSRVFVVGAERFEFGHCTLERALRALRLYVLDPIDIMV